MVRERVRIGEAIGLSTLFTGLEPGNTLGQLYAELGFINAGHNELVREIAETSSSF